MSMGASAPFERAAQIESELKDNARAALDVLERFGVLGAASLVSVQKEYEWGYHFKQRTVSPLPLKTRESSTVRTYRGDQMFEQTRTSASLKTLAHALETSACLSDGRAEAVPVMPDSNSVRRVVSFDPRLANYACNEAAFKELASALCANTWHEASRVSGLDTFDGHMCYRIRQAMVVRKGGVLTHVSGGLRCRIQFNGRSGEEVLQVNAPQSFLPTALIGARTWRNSPLGVSDQDWSSYRERLPVVFHPRVLEKILRFQGQDVLHPVGSPLKVGAVVADPTVNLIDDPGLDGLFTSRGFDDLGQRSHRLALVLKGKLVRHLSRVNVGGGHHWKRPGGPVQLGFSSLLMNRGDVGFHRLLAERPWQILINQIGPLSRTLNGELQAPIEWGVKIDGQGRNVALPSGQFAITGRLFGTNAGPGILNQARLSHELHDTGSAILPYLFSKVRLILAP